MATAAATPRTCFCTGESWAAWFALWLKVQRSLCAPASGLRCLQLQGLIETGRQRLDEADSSRCRGGAQSDRLLHRKLGPVDLVLARLDGDASALLAQRVGQSLADGRAGFRFALTKLRLRSQAIFRERRTVR